MAPPIESLAAFVAETRGGDLPPSTVAATKRVILDTLGCALGALSTDLGQAAVDLAGEFSAGGSCTIPGTGRTATALGASYAIGRLANVLDFDETCRLAGHFAHSALAAALPVCEQDGRSGSELLTAVAVGFEVAMRVALYLRPHLVIEDGRVTGFSGLAGPAASAFGGCAAAAHALGLDAERCLNALAICGSLAPIRSGIEWQRSPELPTIKYHDTGQSAQVGLQSALMAARGITGTPAIFEGAHGLAAMVGMPAFDLPPFRDGLGTTWEIEDTSFKPWPCCRWLHYALTAFVQLIREAEADPDDISAIRVFVHPIAMDGDCSARTDPPRNPAEVEFSYPNSLAMVALGVQPGPAWFQPATIASPRADRLRRTVRLASDATVYEPAAWGDDRGLRRIPAAVEVEIGGRQLRRASDLALGDPWSPDTRLSDLALHDKFLANARALAPDSAAWSARIEETIAAIGALETLAGVRSLTRLTPD